MRNNEKSISPGLFLIFLALFTAGCTLVTTTAKKTVPISKQVTYDDAFEKAVKACRSIGIFLRDANKDAGQVNCFTDYPIKVSLHNYGVDVHLDKDGLFLKNVDVRVWAGGGAIPAPQSGAEALLEKYIKAFKEMGVK